jgi:hypothetical protein
LPFSNVRVSSGDVSRLFSAFLPFGLDILEYNYKHCPIIRRIKNN